MIENCTQKTRVGLIVPSVQSVTEPLFNRLCGSDFDFLAHRMRLLGGKPEDLAEMESHVPEAVDALSDSGVDVYLYCCTASGAIQGREKEAELCAGIELKTGRPAISTLIACVDALKDVGAEKISVVSPNDEDVRSLEDKYLEEVGFDVLNSYGFGIVDGKLFPSIPLQDIIDMTMSGWIPESDALFMSCMNWKAAEVLTFLKKKLNKPVITSHTASLWAVYCRVKENIGYSAFIEKLFYSSDDTKKG